MPALPPPITSRTNARVKALRSSLSGEASGPGDLLGVEGLHLLQEAHRAGLVLDTVYLRDGDEALFEREPWLAGVRAAHWAVLSREVFESAVSTAAPQGIAATWTIGELPPLPPGPAGCLLILENLQDPGNLGTLLRSAEAFGAAGVHLTSGTVNQWNPKVVRSSAGASFRVPVQRWTLPELGERLRAEGVRLFAAVAPSSEPGKSRPSFNVDLSGPCALLIGNEGAGLSPLALHLADERIAIPCKTESLNAAVAGSVLLYEAMRQRRQVGGSSR